MRPVAALFDVVVTTNSGFPLDQNLYQAVKGMSAAATVWHRAATICAAECADGFPAHGSFPAELAAEPTPEPAGLIAPPDPDRAGPVAGAGPGAGAEPGPGRRAYVRPDGTD